MLEPRILVSTAIGRTGSGVAAELRSAGDPVRTRVHHGRASTVIADATRTVPQGAGPSRPIATGTDWPLERLTITDLPGASS